MRTQMIACGSILIFSIWSASVHAENLFIARGVLEDMQGPNAEMTSAHYRIVEVGRGNEETNRAKVIYRTTMNDARILPSEAILLLEKGAWGQLPDSKGRGIFNALGHDPDVGILPYTEQAWKTILQKSDEEMSATPADAQMPKEKAVEMLRGRTYEKYGTPSHVYIYPPRRVPFGWTIAALCVRNGAVKELKVRISDRGNIISEIPNRRPIKFFESADVSAEEMELFIRDYHRNTPPDEWPTWDPEPPPPMSGSAAEEHEASVPLPRNPGPMP